MVKVRSSRRLGIFESLGAAAKDSSPKPTLNLAPKCPYLPAPPISRRSRSAAAEAWKFGISRTRSHTVALRLQRRPRHCGARLQVPPTWTADPKVLTNFMRQMNHPVDQDSVHIIKISLEEVP